MPSARASLFGLLVAASLPAVSAAQQEDPCILTYQAVAPEAVVNVDTSTTREVTTTVALVRRILNAVGVFGIRVYASPGLANACAARPGGRRNVYYDELWLNRYSNGNEWIMIGVLAHEVGHLINDHRRDDGLSSWHKEYEADFFVGRAVAILGGSVEDAMLAVSQQPEDASTGYPSRALRQAAVSEGFLKTRTGSTAAAEPPSDLWEPLDIKVTPDSTSVKFEVENQEFVTNIADFQHGAAIRRPDDVRTQARSASVRLGRAKDMAMISAFRRERDQVCVKHLFLSIRDGENISIEPVRSRWGQGDYYGITYGRRRDLFNVVGIRAADFEFVFDPTEPRLGSSRNPIAKVIDSIAAGTSGISVVEGGCRMS